MEVDSGEGWFGFASAWRSDYHFMLFLQETMCVAISHLQNVPTLIVS